MVILNMGIIKKDMFIFSNVLSNPKSNWRDILSPEYLERILFIFCLFSNSNSSYKSEQQTLYIVLIYGETCIAELVENTKLIMFPSLRTVLGTGIT